VDIRREKEEMKELRSINNSAEIDFRKQNAFNIRQGVKKQQQKFK
jgi:hypothetical protein